MPSAMSSPAHHWCKSASAAARWSPDPRDTDPHLPVRIGLHQVQWAAADDHDDSLHGYLVRSDVPSGTSVGSLLWPPIAHGERLVARERSLRRLQALRLTHSEILLGNRGAS